MIRARVSVGLRTVAQAKESSMRRVIAAAAVAGLGWFSPAVQAAPCAGASPFLDIPNTTGYCTEVEWLKNRGIVTAAGCGNGNYCPGSYVQRSGMAQFMQRLGNRLSPEVLFVETVTGAITVPVDLPLPLRCITPDTAAVAYPRSAVVSAALTGLADGSAIAWRGLLLFSDDNGTTWQNTPTVTALRASSGANQWSGLALTSRIDLAPNKPYRFSIALRRDDQIVGTTGNLSQGRCQLTAEIYSRTGSSSPFDAAAAPSEND